MRDFALAVGRFQTATAVAHAPGRVRVVAAVARGVAVSPAAVAAEVRADLGSLSRRFGPYPWPDLHVAVMPGQSRLGIEYPTMIFLGTGTAGALTTHEVAHQWFYSLVGNDQARDPVLDEGLATYAMGTFFAGVPVVGRAAAPHGRADAVLGSAALPRLSARRVRRRRPRRALARRRAGWSTAPCAPTWPATPTASPPRLASWLRCATVIPTAPARLRRFGIPHTEG